ncbi:MAG TPA: ABC transporter substrate-binding protein [Geothermobacteraceae bacterium]|nr:ABC transporter substrate-binding protein [Geothermobacteraceae bacterium]
MKRCVSPVLIFLIMTVLSTIGISRSHAAGAAVGQASELIPATADSQLGGMSDAEVLRLGEQMYRHGILPSGEVMEGLIHGDIEIDSSAFSCSSCHQRAGLGSFEGGVVTPPTTGNELYQPYIRPPTLNDNPAGQGRSFYAKTILERPAYTRETLKRALRFGEDPLGQSFNEIMPRYPLEDRDMAILVRYLELLSRDYSPGTTGTSFSFATIITDDVSPEDRNALLVPLRRFIQEQNQQIAMFRKFLKLGYKPTGDMKYAFRAASLKVWELKGPASTWKDQLADYLARDKVFAVLGGISNQDWRPIHEFCEARRLPCLFPVTNLPVVSAEDFYTFYFNKGYFQEGEAAARYLKREGVTAILQLVEDSPAGRALAAGFAAGREEIGLPTEVSITLSEQQLQNSQQLAALVAQHQPDVVLLWTNSSSLQALPGIAGRAAAPERIFLSSLLLGQALADIPDTLRQLVFITWPYRLKPYVGDEEGSGFLSRLPIETTWQSFGAPRIASRTATMLDTTIIQGLQSIENNLYRDHLLDEMSMQMDRVVFDYERISFGPGQRFVSKGCYIIQLGPGPQPELVPRSEWVIH